MCSTVEVILKPEKVFGTKNGCVANNFHEGEVSSKRRNCFKDFEDFQSTSEAIETDSISVASDSYEMLEYGLNPYEKEVEQPTTRRRSCVCGNNEKFIIGEPADVEDNFSEPFVARLDHYYMDSEVSKHQSLYKLIQNARGTSDLYFP